MSATIALNGTTSLTLDPLQGFTSQPIPGVLLTIEGRVHGTVLNCAVIPLDKVDQLVEALRLVAHQARP